MKEIAERVAARYAKKMAAAAKLGMDCQPDPPLVFANRIIQRLLGNMEQGLEPAEEDYQMMRNSFRTFGGSWEKYIHGDPVQMDLLSKVIMAWVGLPGRKPVTPTV